MIWYVLLFLGSVLVASISQILLKKNAMITYPNKFREYANLRSALAYGMFFASSLLTVWAYKFVPLSMGPILECSGYVYVTILSAIFIGEKISPRKIIGLLMVILGIVIFGVF